MKLHKLTLENFRNFYGKHELAFSCDEKANVTVVYGANGSGKTTLLNSIIWLLYGITSSDFERKEDLLNHKAKNEAKIKSIIEVRVELEFEHNQKVYTAKKIKKYIKNKNETVNAELSTDLFVTYRDIDGKTSETGNPTELLEQILPKRLQNYFLFNGERMKMLVDEEHPEEIKAGIKNILGLEIIERAIKHLDGNVRKELQRELKDISGNELSNAIEKLQQFEEQVKKNEENVKQHISNINSIRKESEKIDERLSGYKDVKKLQEERLKLEEDLKVCEESIGNVRNVILKIFSKDGFLAFVTPLIDYCENVANEKRKKGELPHGLQQQFVKDLLEAHVCLCNRDLTENTESYNSVASWLQRAGINEIDEALIKVSAQANQFRTAKEDMFSRLNENVSQRVRFLERKQNYIERLSEISKLIGGKDSEEIISLEQKRESLKKDIDNNNQEIGKLNHEIKLTCENIETQKKEIENYKVEDIKQKIAKRRHEVCEKVIDLLNKILDISSQEIRRDLEKKVTEVYSNISYKHYEPVLNENYRLYLKKGSGELEESVAKSTGENQILSLAFIASIAYYAKERYELYKGGKVKGSLKFQGGIYPVVMDSPFGYLDTNYCIDVAHWIPNLAPQVIIFVTKGKGLGEIQESISKKIGKYYVLTNYTTLSTAKEENINLLNKEIPYIKKTKQSSDYVILQEVK